MTVVRMLKIWSLTFLASFAACVTGHDTLDYLGQPPPGDTPVVFAPGVISLQGRFERVPAFSPDGNELFFTVTSTDWNPTIMHAQRVDGRWTEPDTAFFAKAWRNTEPFFSPDGDKLYFASTRPPGSPPYNGDIWMIERNGDGWTEPRHLGPGLNSETSDYHPSVTRDGTIYFASARREERGGDIYRSRLVDGEYPGAESLGDAINSEYQDWDPYVSPDESYLIFKSDRPGGYGDMDLYVSFRSKDGTWSPATNMGPKINTSHHDDAGDVSPDGRFLFFARRIGDEDMDIYWVESSIIDALRLVK